MKVLVTGSGGLLGREVVRALHGSPFRAYPHRALDITDAASVYGALRDDRPDAVINCAGLTKHSLSMPSDVDMRRVNSLGPLLLARTCVAVGARLIHVSTDCVFAGDRPLACGPYTEVDEPDATDVYGESKAFGEVRTAPHLTVRCSFIGWGGGLLEWLAERAASGVEEDHEIDGWDNALWSGSTAPAIARALVELAQRPEVTGLMHLTSKPFHSKAELCDWIVDSLGLPLKVHYRAMPTPYLNRWLATTRADVPALPPLAEALRELRR